MVYATRTCRHSSEVPLHKLYAPHNNENLGKNIALRGVFLCKFLEGAILIPPISPLLRMRATFVYCAFMAILPIPAEGEGRIHVYLLKECNINYVDATKDCEKWCDCS